MIKQRPTTKFGSSSNLSTPKGLFFICKKVPKHTSNSREHEPNKTFKFVDVFNKELLSKEIKKLGTFKRKMRFLDHVAKLRETGSEALDELQLKKNDKIIRKFIAKLKRKVLIKRRAEEQQKSRNSFSQLASMRAINLHNVNKISMRKKRTDDIYNTKVLERRTSAIDINEENGETRLLTNRFKSYISIVQKIAESPIIPSRRIYSNTPSIEQKQKPFSMSMLPFKSENMISFRRRDRKLQQTVTEIDNQYFHRLVDENEERSKKIEKRKKSMIFIIDLWKHQLNENKKAKFMVLNSPTLNKKKILIQSNRSQKYFTERSNLKGNKDSLSNRTKLSRYYDSSVMNNYSSKAKPSDLGSDSSEYRVKKGSPRNRYLNLEGIEKSRLSNKNFCAKTSEIISSFPNKILGSSTSYRSQAQSSVFTKKMVGLVAACAKMKRALTRSRATLADS